MTGEIADQSSQVHTKTLGAGLAGVESRRHMGSIPRPARAGETNWVAKEAAFWT